MFWTSSIAAKGFVSEIIERFTIKLKIFCNYLPDPQEFDLIKSFFDSSINPT
jgi:hypothetical protein